MFVVLLLAAWLLCSRLGLVNPYLLPPPGKVAQAFWQLTADGSLLRHAAISLLRVLAGFGITCLLALPSGILLGMFPRAAAYVRLPLEFLRHVPPLALIPMLILWLGIGEASKLTIIVLASFFPVFFNTTSGVAGCDSQLIEMGKSFGLTRRQVFSRIILPSAAADMLIGLRLGIGYCYRALIGAELIAAVSGLGYLILDAQQLSRSDLVMVGIFAVGVIGIITDWLFVRLTRRFIHWRKADQHVWS